MVLTAMVTCVRLFRAVLLHYEVTADIVWSALASSTASCPRGSNRGPGAGRPRQEKQGERGARRGWASLMLMNWQRVSTGSRARITSRERSSSGSLAFSETEHQPTSLKPTTANSSHDKSGPLHPTSPSPPSHPLSAGRFQPSRTAEPHDDTWTRPCARWLPPCRQWQRPRQPSPHKRPARLVVHDQSCAHRQPPSGRMR